MSTVCVIRAVSDSHLADIACMSSGMDPVPGLQQRGQAFSIISASGTLHTPHFDPNGMGTMLYVHEGYKFLLIAIYTQDLWKLPRLPRAGGSQGLWAILEMEGLIVVAVVAGPADLV
jgi:hypothetical protein